MQKFAQKHKFFYRKFVLGGEFWRGIRGEELTQRRWGAESAGERGKKLSRRHKGTGEMNN